MLPFLGNKDVASGIIAKRVGKPSVEVADEEHAPGQGKDSYNLEECMKSFLGAVERKSAIDMAKEFKAAFEALESEPHEEAGE